ncbi:hypothetical protein GF391_00435 [Candidatus Uhrbacteria bacterium]|nr:hypothetical protein [Candidatus Uhrbacteria bacterium]
MNKYYIKIFSFVALFGMCAAMLPVNAGAIELSRGSLHPNGELESSHLDGDYIPVYAYWDVDGGGDGYASGTQATFTVTWSDTTSTTGFPQHGSSTNLQVSSPCATSSVGGYSAHWNNANVSPSQASLTFSEPVANGDRVGGCVRVPVTDGGEMYKANFSLAVMTSEATGTDYGAVEYYVNGGNDVMYVDATVQATLEFAIVSSTDVTVEEHTCHLGTLNIADVNECEYRLRVTTNASNGFQISVSSDGELNKGGHATITPVVNDVLVTAGTEAYGIAVDEATTGGRDAGTGNFDQPMTDVGDFAADDTPVPTNTTPVMVSYDSGFWGTSTDSTAKITHRAAIDATTLVGYYQQEVKYYISPSF